VSELVSRRGVWQLIEDTFGLEGELYSDEEFDTYKHETMFFEMEYTAPISVILACCVEFDKTLEFMKGINFVVYLPASFSGPTDSIEPPLSISKGSINWRIALKHKGMEITEEDFFEKLDKVGDAAIDLLAEHGF